jgi:hypothetical protein
MALQSSIRHDLNTADDFALLEKTCGILYNLTMSGAGHSRVWVFSLL